jgi:hypothetical protein
MSQGFVSLQVTWQSARHSTAQVVTLAQVIPLPGPARTPQRSTSWQSYWQLAPQNAPQETVLWQEMLQLSPQSAEQSLTPWHWRSQPSPQTPPQ